MPLKKSNSIWLIKYESSIKIKIDHCYLSWGDDYKDDKILLKLEEDKILS